MQDICNWLPVATESEGTRTATMAKTPPGLSPFAQVSLGDAVRGVYNAEGRLFTVIGNTAYQISNSGIAIPLGSISGVGRVRFAHNQITGGNEVLIVNGSSGWVWNTVTSTLTLITDAGYPGAINAAFIDGYLIQIEPARRYAFHSDLADALNYNTLDRFTSEVSPDLLVSMAVSNNELLLFSETTTEFFENTGATQQPFRSKRISFQKGCAGRYTVATMDNTVFWLGDDGVFYLLDGYSPRRISTRPIEQAIRGLNWAQAFAFVWEDSGHSVCYWTFPDGMTFGYDASQQKWHRRASYGFDRWRVSDMAYWQNRWIAGDFQNGRLWELDWGYPLEGEDEFVGEITSPVIHDNQSRVLMPRLEVVMDTGMPEIAARSFPMQPEAPTITGDAPTGTNGAAYSYQYTIAGGTPGYAVTLRSGALPDGLTLSVGGLISGTPTAEGSFEITVRVTDANGLWDELNDIIAIVFPMLLSGATTGTQYIIPGPDGLNWDGAPIASGGAANNAVYMTGLPGNRYFGRQIGAAVPGAHSSNGGVTWTNTADNVTSGAFGDAYTNGALFIPRHTGNSFKSTDYGVTFSSTGNSHNRYVAKDSTSGHLAALDDGTGPFLIVESTDTGATWSAGVSLSGVLDFSTGGCQGWDGTAYYYGGANAGAPKLVRCIAGALTTVTLPTLTGATVLISFAYAPGITTKVVGTDNGLIAFDNGDGNGFRAAATQLPNRVHQIFWNGAVFAAINDPSGAGNGSIYTSTDGDTWTPATITTQRKWYSLAQRIS